MENDGPDPKEMLKIGRDFQVAELNYRREHRWNVFSWAAGLLLGGTGAIFAFGQAITGSNSPHQFLQKMILMGAIAIFVVISSLWLTRHYKKEYQAKTTIREIDTVLGTYKGIPSQEKAPEAKSPIYGWSIVALISLGVFSCLIILATP